MSEYTDYLRDVFMLLGPIAARRRFGVPGITPCKQPTLLDACLGDMPSGPLPGFSMARASRRTPPSATSPPS